MLVVRVPDKVQRAPVPGRAAVRRLQLEPQQPARAGGLRAGAHQCRHLRHEGTHIMFKRRCKMVSIQLVV